MHGVDDLVGEAFLLGEGGGLLGISPVSEHFEGEGLGLGVGLEEVVGVSVAGLLGGVSLVLDGSGKILVLLIGSLGLGGDLSGVLVGVSGVLGVSSGEDILHVVGKFVEEGSVLLVAVWSRDVVLGGAGGELVGVVVVHLLEGAPHLSSVGFHGILEGGLLLIESGVEGSFALGDDVGHVGVILSDGGLEGGGGGLGESSEGGSLVTSEGHTLSSLLSHGGGPSGLDGGNSVIDGLLLGLEKSEQVVSVVGILLPLGVGALLSVLGGPGGEAAVDEGVEGVGGGADGCLLGGAGVSEDLLASGEGIANSLPHLGAESVELSLEFSPGGSVGFVTVSLLGGNSVLHGFQAGNDGGFVLLLEVGDGLEEFGVVAVVGTVDVALSVSEFPDELLDGPEDSGALIVDFLFPTGSGGFNTGEGTILSVCEFLCKSLDGGVEGGNGGGESAVEGVTESLLGSLNPGLSGGLLFIDIVGLSLELFLNTLHGPFGGCGNESSFVVDVLDVEVLSVGEDSVVLLNCNTLEVSGVSVSGAVAPGASVSGTLDFSVSSVSEAVRNLDPFPGLLAVSDPLGNSGSLVSSPGGEALLLCSLELFEEGGLGGLALLEGGGGGGGVGIEGGGLGVEASIPGGLNVEDVGSPGGLSLVADGVLLGSGGGKGLVERVLVVVVVDGGDVPSDLLLHAVEFSDLGVEGGLEGSLGISDTLVDGGGSVGLDLSPGGVLSVNGIVPLGPSGIEGGGPLVPCLSLDGVEASLGSGDSSFVLGNNELLSGGHLLEDGGDLLVLLLLVAVAPAPVAISEWVIAIF